MVLKYENMTRIMIVIVLLLSSYAHLFAGSTSKSVFELYSWLISPNNLYYRFDVDSTIITHPLLLEPNPELRGQIGFTAPFPYTDGVKPKIEVKVRYKSENCPMLYLRLATIGDYEEMVDTDTLFLPSSKEWITSSQLMNIGTGNLLSLSVEAIGNARDKITTSFERTRIRFANNAKIWIDELEILINGKKMTEVQTNNSLTTSLTKEDFISLNGENRHHLPFLNKKVLAIGETVHGTSTMNSVAIEIMKDRIKNRKCKFVLLEIPLEFSFYINRYVSGDHRFTLDSISTYFDHLLFSEEFISFIHWLKEYNLSLKEKVTFIGIDADYTDLLAQINLFNFFYAINLGINDNELNKICISLLSQNKELPYKTSLAIFDNNQGFNTMLSEKESKLIRSCLTRKDPISFSYFQRDSIMYEHTKFVVTNLLKDDETVTVFCHFGHTNYLCEREMVNSEDWNFGHYMKNEYQEDYSNIALVTEMGNFLTKNGYSKMKEEKLQISPSNSLEYLMNKQGIDLCYLSMDKFTYSDVMSIRFIGNRNRCQPFISIIPKSRMDGVIFIKESSAIHKSNEILNKSFDVNIVTMDAFMRASEKRKKIQLEN